MCAGGASTKEEPKAVSAENRDTGFASGLLDMESGGWSRCVGTGRFGTDSERETPEGA